jgi:ribosome maturation factor RimP
MSELYKKIEDGIKGIVEELGCSIIRITFLKSRKTKTLQIMIEKLNGDPCNINDCEKVSKAVSVNLDVLALIDGHYNLEVTSAGVERPLVKPVDYIRFCGNAVAIKTYVSKNNRHLFKGTLESVSEAGIRIVLDTPLLNGETILNLKYEEISEAYIDGFKFLKKNFRGDCCR